MLFSFFCLVADMPSGVVPYYKVFLKARGYEVTEESMRGLLQKESKKEDRSLLQMGLDAIRHERMKGLAADVKELGVLPDPYESRRVACLLTIDENIPISEIFEHLNRERKILFEVKDVSPSYRKDSVEVLYAAHVYHSVNVRADLLRIARRGDEEILQYNQGDAFRKALEWYDVSLSDTELQQVLDSWKEQPTSYNYFLMAAQSKGLLLNLEALSTEPQESFAATEGRSERHR